MNEGGDTTSQNMKEMLVEKAHELFDMCDKEKKGIVTKRDMQHLISELPLSSDQLEIVFDSLDKDTNGFLTLQEFTDGFGIDTSRSKLNRNSYYSDHGMDQPLDDIEEEVEDCEDAFDSLLSLLGGRDLIKDEDNVRQIWMHLRELNMDICRKFEEVLAKLIQEIKASKMECVDLETLLKRMIQHDQEVTQLYEEMERQISAEKEELLAEERTKEKKIRDELEKELCIKERALQELLTKQSQMENRLSEMTSSGTETKQENTKLQKERDALEQRLLKSERLVQEMQRHLEGLRHETLEDKRKRAKATLEVTEGIALERENIVRELDVLRSANRKLLDEKDFLDSSFGNKKDSIEEIDESIIHHPLEDNCSAISAASTKGILTKQGSVLSDYIYSGPGTPRTSLYSGISGDDKERQETDEEEITVEPNSDVAKWVSERIKQEASAEEEYELNTKEEQETKENAILTEKLTSQTNNAYTFTGENASQVVWKVKCIVYPEAITDTVDDTREVSKLKNEWKSKKIYHSFCDGEARCFVPEKEEVVKIKRNVCQTLSNSSQLSNAQYYWKVHLTVFPASMFIIPFPEEDFVKKEIDLDIKTQTPVSPERVFKIVFIGDSGVGKSSFIQRFCHNQFRPHYSATIGVDFQVRSVEVAGRTVALQFWDTAGQERFRSITKQYYRKADGIIIMYDVTSEASFRSIRGWVNNIKDDTSDFAVMLLIGNKVDLCKENENRMIAEKDGRQLAQEYEALFYETSSCTGHQVEDSVMEMASLLQVKEDEELERVLCLQEVAKKNKCC